MTIDPNPTRFVFACNQDSLREVIISKLFKYKGMDLYFEGSEYPLEAKEIFTYPENRQDFYLSNVDLPWLKKSYVYPGLWYNASFHLHINSIDATHTEVIINTINPQVIIGKKILPTFPHFARDYKYEDVEPSTIEEYEILFLIGQELGMDMPAIKYPK